MRSTWRKIVALAIMARLLPASAVADIVPTYNSAKYGEFLSEIESLDKQIHSWAQVVGAIRTQIDTLQNVSDAIYHLKDVMRESVRGVAGSIAQQTGIKDVLAPLAEMQKTYTDAMYLYRDLQQLPQEARQQMEQIGFSIKDVQAYLRDGVVYDTFNRLDLEDWQQLGKNPWRAFENGSVGMAIMRSEYYLGEGASGGASRGEAWDRYTAALTPADRDQMGALMGPSYALMAAGEWFDDLGHRVQQAADYRDVANRLAAKIAPTGGVTVAQPPDQKTVVEDLQTRNAVGNLNLKATATGMANDGKAQNAVVTAEAARLQALQQADRMERQNDTTDAMTGGQP
jgi:hypothetical protein